MFLDKIKQTVENVVATVVTPENVETVKCFATTVLTNVKNGVNNAVDFAVEAINEIGTTSPAEVDKLHEDQRKMFFDNLLETLVNNNPNFKRQYTRFVDWLRTVPYEKVTHYLALFQDGEIIVDSDSFVIDGPDFFVPAESNEIRYKSKQVCSDVLEFCTSQETAIEDAKKVGADVFYCRVTVPNAGCHNEEFPELYMVCFHGNKIDMRRDYISFIMDREEKYKQAMVNHRNDPRNQRHTDWKANVQVCRMSKE